MLMSVDGKISTRDSDAMDVDKDFPQISGIKEGLQQYYDIESQTDIFSFNTGRVLAKVGMNNKSDEPQKTSVCFVVVDNEPHLTRHGIEYLAKKAAILIIVTTNKNHPAISLADTHNNIKILTYDNHIDFENLFAKLKNDFGAERMTIQSGGTLNTILLRLGLIDRLLLVVAPALIGGKDTATLLDGESLHAQAGLFNIKALELVQAKPLNHSYLFLEYKIKNTP